MAIDTIKSSAVLDGAIATVDIADDAVTSAKLDTNISVDGNLGLGTSVSTRKLNVNAGSYGHMLLDTANAAHGIQILGQANAAANSGFDIQYAASTGLKVRTLAVQPLSLQTSASAGSPSDRLHIHTSGVVSIPQGIELGSGVDATAANTLDDYEEGTFTPSFTQGIGSPAYTTQNGRYTKIGRVVYIETDLRLSGGTPNGSHVFLGGLPFTSSSAAPYSAFDFQYNGGWHNISYPSLWLVIAGSTYCAFYRSTDGGAIAGTSISSFTNATVRIGGWYTT